MDTLATSIRGIMPGTPQSANQAFGPPGHIDNVSHGTNGGAGAHSSGNIGHPQSSINEVMGEDEGLLNAPSSSMGIGLEGGNHERDIGVQNVDDVNSNAGINGIGIQQFQCFDQLNNNNNDENGGDTENLRGGGIGNNSAQFGFHTGESPSFMKIYTPNPNNRGVGGNGHGGDQAFNCAQISSQFQYQVFYSFMENQLIESIKASLNHELYSNAAFLCERLYAHVQNEDVKHLLAQCYLGEGKAYKAFEVLKDCESAKNRYKFALTCIKLARYHDAELALTGANLPQNQSKGPSHVLGNHHLDLHSNRSIPHGAPGYYLLGYVLECQYKNEKAAECYERALQLQPTLWCAFERLCRLQGGPAASHDRVDAARIFTEHNSDIQQMNGLIREHMMNIQQVAAQGPLAQDGRSGIVVNNFDQSPMANSNATALDQKFLDDPACINSQAKQKNHNLKFLQTNQKTPAPSKPVFYNRDMKENMASEGMSAGVGCSSIQSAGGRVAGAPQKHMGLVDHTSSGGKADEANESKFDEEPIIHNGGASQSQIDYDYDKNLKTPTPSGQQHQITPTSHVNNDRHLRKSMHHVHHAPSQSLHPSRLVFLNNYTSNGAGSNLGAANAGAGSQHPGAASIPSQLHFSSNSKDGANVGTIHATETKNPAGLYNQGSGEYFAYGANAHLAGSAAPSSSLHLHQARRGGNLGLTQQPQALNLNANNSMVSQHNYTSFFNQTNIIGDPVVKPFTIGTPIQPSNGGGGTAGGTAQQQHSYKANLTNSCAAINQNFVAARQATDGKNSQAMADGGPGGPAVGTQSASKQIGAHLLQMQQTGGKHERRGQDESGSGLHWDLIALLRHLGQAYQMQADYRCAEAIQMYKKLPKAHLQTAWVSAQIARCHFELSQYTEAAKMYETMVKQQAYRLEGLEYYSTCLWHLRKQMDLCYIANYALERSLQAPETWCILGNCHALQKEHETALKFFGRAIQLNPFFAYAHSLSGHEYVEIEDFEQAKKCYGEALKTEERHYTAWWGLGNIFQKQEKYEAAAYNFNQALAINSRSAVLHTYLGMTLHNQNLLSEACACFDKASELDPSNILNKYQKSQVLLTMNKEQEALELLLDLKQELPKEAPVFIGIGKIYKKLGQVQPALENFSAALDLDPKDINQVSNMMKTIDQQHEMSDEQNDVDF